MVQRVFSAYLHLMGFKATFAPEMMNLPYNSLRHNLTDYHPKLEVLLRIDYGLFPSTEEEVLPDYPAKLAKHLNRDELAARFFAACLGNDKERIRHVSEIMKALSCGEYPTLAELEKWYDEKDKDK